MIVYNFYTVSNATCPTVVPLHMQSCILQAMDSLHGIWKGHNIHMHDVPNHCSLLVFVFSVATINLL